MAYLSINGLLQPVLITLLALVCARFFVRDTAASDTHEFAALDGLRGLLALTVFIHHSVYWFYHSRGQGWHGGDSVLYENFGQTSICLFFMVSGFLFGHKLLEARQKPLDWLRLYCSRLLRLGPLYFTVLLFILALITVKSGFTMHQDWHEFWTSLRHWLLFTIPSHADINGFPNTHLLTAGVVWTLPYEWYFYLCLPAVSLLLGSRSQTNPLPWLLISAACVLTFSYWGLDSTLLWGFVGGFVAALAIRHTELRRLLRGMNWVVLACLIIGYTCFTTNEYYTRLLILTVAFTSIAAGTNLFGVLTSRSCRALSNISYGIYLLHGLVLYLTFNWVLSPETSIAMTEQQHVLLMIAITPVIVAISALSWHWVEWPAMQNTTKLARWLRSLYPPTPVVAPASIDPSHSMSNTQPSQRTNELVEQRHD